MFEQSLTRGRWACRAARLIDVLLPRHCLLCTAPASGAALCRLCRQSLPAMAAETCRQCALPASGTLCGRCQLAAPAYDATVAAFSYGFPLDVLIQGLKYRSQLGAVADLAAALAEAGQSLLAEAGLILPMPVHRRRLAERGYNQAVELARPLARASGLPLGLQTVRKLRNTSAQAGLERALRLRNQRGAFRCEAELDGVHVLVIDDVMTTGATLAELARCLKAAGAARVSNLVLARAC